VIGLGIYFIQKYLKVIKLDPEIYFVDYAPVELIPWQFVALNICVGVAILAILIIPSYLIAKISPAKSIKCE
jgi:lipoprotein-releasing system permease protein